MNKKGKLLSCPGCLNPFKVGKIPKGFIEAGTKCPSCEIEILRRQNPGWHWIKKNDYYLGTYMNNDLDISKMENNLHNSPKRAIHLQMDVDTMINKLNQRERDIVLYLRDGYNMREVGDKYGITKQRVEQIIKVIRDKLME